MGFFAPFLGLVLERQQPLYSEWVMLILTHKHVLT
jgi:hypothetical protein